MKIRIYDPQQVGVYTERDATNDELRQLAKEGHKEAIRDLVQARGGWDSLSATQKEKVTRLLLGESVDL